MEIYKTDISNMGAIRNLFYGFIFRKIEDGVGYVKCGLKQKEIIESVGIELTLKTNSDDSN